MRYMPKMMAASSTTIPPTTPPTIAPIGFDLVDVDDVDDVDDVEELPTSGCPSLLILCAVAASNCSPVQLVGSVVAQNGIEVSGRSVILAG
jgi:hypothetical protein